MKIILSFFLSFFFLLMESYCVAQAGRELLGSNDPSASASYIAGIKVTPHQAKKIIFFLC
jgi:hypothetical protein